MTLFGDYLRAEAKRRGLSPAGLARRCDISERVFYTWINETRYPNIENLARLTSYLGVSADTILELMAAGDDEAALNSDVAHFLQGLSLPPDEAVPPGGERRKGERRALRGDRRSRRRST